MSCCDLRKIIKISFDNLFIYMYTLKIIINATAVQQLMIIYLKKTLNMKTKYFQFNINVIKIIMEINNQMFDKWYEKTNLKIVFKQSRE